MDTPISPDMIPGARFFIVQGARSEKKRFMEWIVKQYPGNSRLLDMDGDVFRRVPLLWQKSRRTGVWYKVRSQREVLNFPECRFDSSGDIFLDHTIVDLLWNIQNPPVRPCGGDEPCEDPQPFVYPYTVVVSTRTPEATATVLRSVPHATCFNIE